MNYQDAAQVCLMWHCFGRSSDLGYAQKQHVSVSAGGVFYLRLLRVKTAVEQGLTLVPDKQDFLACQLLTIAVALVMQKAPCPQLLDQLPALTPQDVDVLEPGAPLHDLLAADPASLQAAVVPTVAPPSTTATLHPPTSTQLNTTTTPSPKPPRTRDAKRGEEGVHTHVNRLLKRVADPAGASLVNVTLLPAWRIPARKRGRRFGSTVDL